jgi:zinc protease
VLDVTGHPAVAGEALESAVADVVDSMRSGGVGPDEVERALALIETAFVTSMQSAGDRADKLSLFATYFGDPSLINEQIDRYRAVTAEQVTEFVRSRMGEDNRASLLYVPSKATTPQEDATGATVAVAS